MKGAEHPAPREAGEGEDKQMPATLTTNAKARTAFGSALGEAMDQLGMSQAALGERLNHMRQPAISAWINGHALPPDIETVFKVEKVLKLAPGTLSKYLGFLPPKAPVSVLDAIHADQALDASGKRAMTAVYEELISRGRRRKALRVVS